MMKSSTAIQAFVFDKDVFKNNNAIYTYLGYKRRPKIINFTKTKRVIIKRRSKFKQNSFRTKKIGDGVKVVKGVLYRRRK